MSEDSPAPAPRSLPVHALIFGGVAGAIAAVLRWAEFAFGFYGGAADILILFVPLIGIILGVMRWRDGVLGGSIGFARAFGAALAVGLVFVIVQAGFAWVHVHHLQPDLTEKMAAAFHETLPTGGRSAEEIAAAEKNFRERVTPDSYPQTVFVSWLPIVFISGLLTSLFMRRSVRP